MIDSRQLRCLIAVAEEAHFGRAALRLGLAQSALSGQIRRLEDNLGACLFERGRRAAVRLTPFGAIFLEEACATLDRMDRAERVGRAAARGEAGPARLHYVFSAALCGILTEALKGVAGRLPLLHVNCVPMETPEQLAALSDARADAGFLRPQDDYPPGVSARIVHSERMIIAMSAAHRLARQERLRCADLAGETFIIPQAARSMGLPRFVQSLAQAGRFATPPFIDCSDFLTAACIAASGGGVVLAPRSLTNMNIGGLCFRPLDDFEAGVDLALAWREPRPPIAAVILDVLGQPSPDRPHG
ncbi:Transcriptional regulator, LysR family [Sphingomonas paucimobilis]|nr:Transcriptional regulator, LysR family [Sphingomonas paucimobilis]